MAFDHGDDRRGSGPGPVEPMTIPESGEHPLEEALRVTEARLTAAIGSLPFDFWMIGPDGRYVMQNAHCEESWGDDIIGKHPDEVAPDEETRRLWADNNRRAFAGEVVRDEVQFPIGGRHRHFYNVISPIHQDDLIVGILGLNLDITARKEAEEALRKRNQELSEANRKLEEVGRAKDRLTALISHELRSPLVTGLGYVDLLLDGRLGPISPEIRSRMTIAQGSLRRLATLIDGVLDYQGFLHRGARGIPPTGSFDLGDLLTRVTDEFRASMPDPSLLRVEVVPGLPHVRGERAMIRMVLVNLLNNAVAHGGATAAIMARVEESRVPGFLKVTVADDGPGIAPELMGSVFDPFVKGSSDRDRFGLGLAVVSAILSAHGTTADLESGEGQGTRISFRLPAAESDASAPGT